VRPSDFYLILVVIAAAIAARVVILFGLLPLLTGLRVSPAVERPYAWRSSGAACAAR
jgi:monovalent cation:H+ antiporter, CPA1 family